MPSYYLYLVWIAYNNCEFGIVKLDNIIVHFNLLIYYLLVPSYPLTCCRLHIKLYLCHHNIVSVVGPAAFNELNN